MNIQEEIARLSPWHYNLLIEGFSTGELSVEILHPKLVQLLEAGAFSRTTYPFVLDLGSNAGAFSFYFADNKFSLVDAIEFHPRYYEQLKLAIEYKGYITKVVPIFKDVCEGHFGHSHYDLVLCLGLLHHLPEPCQLSVLQEARKALIAGGEIVVQTAPNIQSDRLLKEAGFVNIRQLDTQWVDRVAFEAIKDPMKLHD